MYMNELNLVFILKSPIFH